MGGVAAVPRSVQDKPRLMKTIIITSKHGGGSVGDLFRGEGIPPGVWCLRWCGVGRFGARGDLGS